nr:MAG TPA: hypothetical protein [Caudoviricetes sp.]
MEASSELRFTNPIMIYPIFQSPCKSNEIGAPFIFKTAMKSRCVC